MGYKQVILIRNDLKLPKGKMAGQAAHAAVEAALKCEPDKIRKWRLTGSAKIVVKVDSKEELYKYIQEAKDCKMTTSVITDAGRTVIEPGTVTCAAIGPEEEEAIDAITGKIKLM
jgi:PTH2 family peptidyl-tRNA hydrolase